MFEQEITEVSDLTEEEVKELLQLQFETQLLKKTPSQEEATPKLNPERLNL